MLNEINLIIFFILYGLLIFVYYFCRNKIEAPKNLNKNIKNYYHKFKRVSVDKDKYKLSKVPTEIDTIVIGSGIGGLSCGALLSRVGQKVLVLEQHYIAGGCMHVFEEKGVEHETGIHYIGNIKKRQPILDLITTEPIEWCQLGENNNNIYDEIYIGDKHYVFRAGENNFINDLSSLFPNEKQNIKNYINLVKKVAKEDLFFNLKIIQNNILLFLLKLYLKYWNKDFYKYLNVSAYDVISTFTDNEELKSVLCGQFGDHGIPPKKANFFIHASIVYHYLEGGYFPKGGPSKITKNIIPVIEKMGGRVLVGKKVKEIIINNEKAIGVEMENGDKIYSQNVVSAVGVNNTFSNLVNHKISDKFKNLINKIGTSTSFISCFINLNGTIEELELRQSNLWIYPHKNLDELIKNFDEDLENNLMPLFISSGSAKDTTWNNRYPDKSSVILLCPVNIKHFKYWEFEKCTNRNLDYKDFKNLLAQRMINILYKYYPKTKGKITNVEVGTPLTNQHYLGYLDGEGYGLESSKDRYSNFDLKPKTEIKNLYLTGQDICTLGFTGALMGGVLTAHSILGYGTLMDIILDKNLINDLIKMDNKKL